MIYVIENNQIKGSFADIELAKQVEPNARLIEMDDSFPHKNLIFDAKTQTIREKTAEEFEAEDLQAAIALLANKADTYRQEILNGDTSALQRETRAYALVDAVLLNMRVKGAGQIVAEEAGARGRKENPMALAEKKLRAFARVGRLTARLDGVENQHRKRLQAGDDVVQVLKDFDAAVAEIQDTPEIVPKKGLLSRLFGS